MFLYDEMSILSFLVFSKLETKILLFCVQLHSNL